MRQLATIEAVRATTLVATPTGAADFLARLHMEFLVDPLELELRRLVLAGEIADPVTYRHLAAEFGAAVSYLYLDPVFGVGLAAGDATDSEVGLDPVQPGLLAAAPLTEDRLLDLSADGRTSRRREGRTRATAHLALAVRRHGGAHRRGGRADPGDEGPSRTEPHCRRPSC